jgi:hypothetical protein
LETIFKAQGLLFLAVGMPMFLETAIHPLMAVIMAHVVVEIVLA